ncbi:hypothetical protein GCM10009527_023320 [Actinomadura nitritigenes]
MRRSGRPCAPARRSGRVPGPRLLPPPEGLLPVRLFARLLLRGLPLRLLPLRGLSVRGLSVRRLSVWGLPLRGLSVRRLSVRLSGRSEIGPLGSSGVPRCRGPLGWRVPLGSRDVPIPTLLLWLLGPSGVHVNSLVSPSHTNLRPGSGAHLDPT